MKECTCCFTGHRALPAERLDAITAGTESKIRELILRHGYRYFGVGGAIGYDTVAAQILFRLRETDFPQIKVILVYPFDGFTNQWSDRQRTNYVRMLTQYDKTVCVARKREAESYLARNRHLVDNSSFCIAFCTQKTGGTAYTVRYAQQKNVSVYNVADFDINQIR